MAQRYAAVKEKERTALARNKGENVRPISCLNTSYVVAVLHSEGNRRTLRRF